jgi:hypothetical protein
MIHTTYPQVIEKVLSTCDKYIEEKCSAKQLHGIIIWAEDYIVNFEEKDLRNFFTIIEGDIDYIRVMANETDFEYRDIPEIENREKMLQVISKIKEKLLSS